MRSLLEHPTFELRETLSGAWTTDALKAAIIGVALLLMVLALCINNKWVLAAILAYAILP